MGGVLYYAEWDCRKCGTKLRAFFKEEAVVGPGFNDHIVECPICQTQEELARNPYRLDKQVAEHWESVWEK